MTNLLDFDLDGLTHYFAEMGEKPFRAKQVMRWMHQMGADDFGQMSDLAKSLREKLVLTAEIQPPRILSEHRSKTAPQWRSTPVPVVKRNISE